MSLLLLWLLLSKIFQFIVADKKQRQENVRLVSANKSGLALVITCAAICMYA